MFKKDDNKEIRLAQNVTRGEADFNQFIQLRNQLVNAAENFAREEDLTPVLILTMTNYMDDQLKLSHKVVDVVDRANRKICVTLVWYDVDKPNSFNVQVRIFARKKEDENFQQFVSVNYKLEEFIYLLDVINSVYNKFITKQPSCKISLKKSTSAYSMSQFFYWRQD